MLTRDVADPWLRSVHCCQAGAGQGISAPAVRPSRDMKSSTHPRFQHPPVMEVALGVQFKPLASFGVPQIGRLWERFRERFPKVEHQPQLDHEIERRGAQLPQVSFRVLEPNRALLPRVWMINDSGTELLQVQQDRFVRNWRRYSDGTARYPEYLEHLRPSFVSELGEFVSFIESEGLGAVEFDQCDLSYVNHIEPNEVWSTTGDWWKVFPSIAPAIDKDSGGPLDYIGLRMRREMVDANGDFLGRLHIQLDSTLSAPRPEKPEPHPLFILQLIARGSPVGRGVEGVLSFLDLGHDAIVTTFANITSSAMHGAWGRTA